jgi:hypothetical protein
MNANDNSDSDNNITPPVDKQHWKCRTAPHIKAQTPTIHSAASGPRHSRHAKNSHAKNSRASCRPTPPTCHAKNSQNGRPKTPISRALIGRRYRVTLGPIANTRWLYNNFVVPKLRPIAPAIVPAVVPATVYSAHCSARHSAHARHCKWHRL